MPVLGLVALTVSCAPHKSVTAAPDPVQGNRDLIVLLPDPGTNNVGRAIVSNASGTVDLEGARASTMVAPNQPPSAVTRISESEVRELFQRAVDTLPEAPQHFILNFRFDSDELTQESRASVPQILEAVKKRPFPDVLVLGHTDTAGPAAANVALGLKRAEMIRKLLVDSGLRPSLIEVDSHGESDLLVKTADEVAEPRNRRVEITVR